MFLLQREPTKMEEGNHSTAVYLTGNIMIKHSNEIPKFNQTDCEVWQKNICVSKTTL